MLEFLNEMKLELKLELNFVNDNNKSNVGQASP